MKKNILKIAGVKSEKEFYKKFPDEASFMAKHGKEFKKAMRESKIDKAQVGQQIPQLSGENFQPTFQYIPSNISMYNPYARPTTRTAALPRTQLGNVKNMSNTPITSAVNKGDLSVSSTPTGTQAPSGIAPYVGAGIDVIQGISMIKQQRDALREAKQQAALAGLFDAASASAPVQPIENEYFRPEDVVFQPEEMFPSYGVGTEVLAEFGASVGGGEIMNTFAPNTIYTNMGYEPLDETSKMKQYVDGGKLKKAKIGNQMWMQDTKFGNFMMNEGGIGTLGSLSGAIQGEPEAGSKIGKGIGTAAGTALGGPIGGAIGGFLGEGLGGIIDPTEERIKRYEEQGSRHMGNIMGRQVGIDIRNRFGLQDGGEMSPYKWVSHTWLPQKIVSFGGHNVKDLLKPPHDADMLRAGGHLKEYTPPSAAAMSTERPAMQMGGELQTHWGGYAEPMSYNPYLPDGGETIMFRGQSHDESDGKGNTGIGITYGENPVEVERGEPAVKLQDGGTGESNLTVFGNIKITNAFADMLADSKAKGKKFKTYVADLSKQENKQNKLIDKSLEQLDELNVQTSFDKLALGTLQANIEGANAKLKDLADKKINAASLQNAINDTKEENLLEVTDKGDVLAKKGADIPKAQKGLSARADVPKQTKTGLGYGNISKSDIERMKANNPWYDWSKFDPANPEDVLEFQQAFNKKAEEIGSRARLQEDKMLGQQTVSARGLYDDRTITPLPRIAIPDLSYTLPTPSPTPSKTVKPVVPTPKKFDWMTAFNQLVPYLRPSDAEALDTNQLIGEMYALATNQVEPVRAQTFQPQLSVPFDISLQDILNENEASFRSQQRLLGYNPAAQGMLNAQKYQANQKVLGEQFRLNQAEKQRVYEQNRNLLNQSQLQNLGILDQQYVRQAQALSNTKATTQAALSSIASKYAQNKLDNRTLATYENLYNYRFDPRFRAINMNPLAQFDTTLDSMASSGVPQAPEGYEYETVLRKKRKDSDAKNGAILKAVKNL